MVGLHSTAHAYRTRININEITQLADQGPASVFSVSSWQRVARAFNWLASHNACFHSLRRLMQPDLIHITSSLLMQATSDSAALVNQVGHEFKSMPASCVLQHCNECITYLGTCPLTGVPKKACSLQHYRLAKRLHSQTAMVHHLQQPAAYNEAVSAALSAKLRPWEL